MVFSSHMVMILPYRLHPDKILYIWHIITIILSLCAIDDMPLIDFDDEDLISSEPSHFQQDKRHGKCQGSSVTTLMMYFLFIQLRKYDGRRIACGSPRLISTNALKS